MGGSAPRPPLTAFVFSGGAALGALQVGMLTALYERGLVADMLIGTCAGALNAAFVASRPQTVETARELARVWRGLKREDVFPASISALVGGLWGQRDHVVSDRALRRLVRRYVELDDLAEAATPLHALALGAERIYVLATHDGSRRLRPAPRTALDAAMYALNLVTDGRLDADVARYSHEAELIVLPAPNPLPVQPSDFGHAGHLIREARDAARAALAGGGLPVATMSSDRRGLRIA
jgi:NTE family protein